MRAAFPLRRLLLSIALLSGCAQPSGENVEAERVSLHAPVPSLTAAADIQQVPSANAASTARAVDAPKPREATSAAPVDPPSPAACGENMSLVEGNYCLTPEQKCLGHQVQANQCARYAEPVTCFDERRKPLRFCMDRFEWPNRRGEVPRVLVSWQKARETCEGIGKRLCTEEEFNFACEGEEMRPFVYGFERDATKCNFDLPYRPRTFKFTAFDDCLANDGCRAAFEAIDQRKPSGAFDACRSPAGIYDLNGNVNEWVMIPGNKSPHRSGLKGGWWGPVRNRCRPTVTFHDEGDFGYEVGFRCCGDAR